MNPLPDTEVDLDALHDASAASIAAAFPIFKTVEAYRADRKSLPVPACLLSLIDMEPDPDHDPGTEQLAVVASFEAQLILGFRRDEVERAVRKLAGAVAAHIHQQRWGQPVDAAQVMSISPDDFDPELDRYVVWRIEWQHVIHLGVSVFTDDGTIPTTVLSSWDPEVGPENEEAYEPVVEGDDE